MKSSKQKKAAGKGNSPAPPAPTRAFVIWGIVVLGIIALVVVSNRRSQTGQPHGDPAASPTAAPGSTNLQDSTTAPSDFQKLKGRWLRPDGGYVLEIKSVQDQGKLNAAYFNPKPINVAKAEASQAGATTKVFVELRDVNYPGSTYTLTYLADKDLLVGIYYQALQQQSFEVYFERMP
jgi:hypothetical protein